MICRYQFAILFCGIALSIPAHAAYEPDSYQNRTFLPLPADITEQPIVTPTVATQPNAQAVSNNLTAAPVEKSSTSAVSDSKKEPSVFDEQKYQAVTVPQFFVSHDSEDFNTVKVGAGYYPYYEHGDSLTGVRASANHYSQNGFSEDGQQMTVISKKISPRNGLGYQAEVGASTQSGHTTLITDSRYATRLGDTTTGEVFIARDWVETARALDNGVSFTFVGADVEQQIFENLSAIGLVGRQIFTDGNNRDHVRGRLIYSVLPDYGINLQARYRAFFNDDTSTNYFNPDDYQEGMLAIGLRKRYEGWLALGTLGIGRQSVAGDPYTTTKLAELEVTSPFVDRYFLRSKIGYSESVGFNGPDYSYQYLQGELVYRF